MKTSKEGRAFIEAFEGLSLKAYDDGEGVMTIGYGHTTAAGPPRVYPGMTISRMQADEILTADLAPVETRVARLIGIPLRQNEFDALVSFDFNTGDLQKSSIPRKINAGYSADAMATLSQYVHGANSGNVYSGLVRRRRGEKLMFEGDVVGALQLADVHDTSGGAAPQKPKPPPPNIQNQIPTPKPPQQPALAAFLSSLLSIFRRK